MILRKVYPKVAYLLQVEFTQTEVEELRQAFDVLGQIPLRLGGAPRATMATFFEFVRRVREEE